jgi:ribonuclease kappa
MGGHEDPEDGGAVAGVVFGAVFIYIVRSNREQRSAFANAFQGFFVFCGLQALLHIRESRRGAISLS